jgi:hypothetical protein
LLDRRILCANDAIVVQLRKAKYEIYDNQSQSRRRTTNRDQRAASTYFS